MKLLLCLSSIIVHSAALKIAIGDESGNGEGMGCGSTSRITIDDVFNDLDILFSSSESTGQPQTSTVQSGGVEYDAAVQGFNQLTDFTTAGMTVAASLLGNAASISISAACAAEILADAGITTGSLKTAMVSPTTEVTDVSGSETIEISFKHDPGTGAALTDITVADLTSKIRFVLQKKSNVEMECVTWTGTAWTTDGDETISQTATTITCELSHLTTGGARPKGSGLKGDPKVSNLAGKNFEILAMGTFSLLSISSVSSPQDVPKLTLDATIDRAGDMCGATYIRNATIAGAWIKVENSSKIRIAAVAGSPKERALEISFQENTWHAARFAKSFSNFVEKTSKKSIELKIHGLQIQVVVDAHRVRHNGIKTGQFANFLNIDVKGIKNVEKENVHLAGLLAYDDHKFAEIMPDGCNSKSFHFKQHTDTTVSEKKFLSSAKGNL